MDKDLLSAEFTVTGLVQGVGFRFYVYRIANQLDLTGYTKNMPDGSVLTVAEGNKNSIDKLHDALKIGPSRSYVEKVVVSFKEYTGKYYTFDVR